MAKRELPPDPKVTEWKRTNWARFFRWIGFGAVLSLVTGVAMTSFYSHFQMGRPLVLKEFILYLLMLFMTGVLIPQIIFEVDYIRDDGDELRIRNLFLSFKEKWSELKWLYNRPFLKFAILRGKKFIYFLNKKDLQEFDKLVETIREKAPQLPE
ncbi:MAG: hypothetical protein K2W95_17195 [Candidatus Obscuribacterales bacterium]|nr:hypothetical protein [Candidatus Obscuribacterales bacterium]